MPYVLGNFFWCYRWNRAFFFSYEVSRLHTYLVGLITKAATYTTQITQETNIHAISGVKLMIPVIEWLQTGTWDHTATRIGLASCYIIQKNFLKDSFVYFENLVLYKFTNLTLYDARITLNSISCGFRTAIIFDRKLWSKKSYDMIFIPSFLKVL